MHDDKTNEKISQFLDNELDVDQAIALLYEIQHDNELQKTLMRYETASQALKTETLIQPRADFLSRIQQEIAHDPVYLMPELQRKKQEQDSKVIKFKPQHKVLALVASAAALAAILPQNMTNSTVPHLGASSVMHPTQHVPFKQALNQGVSLEEQKLLAKHMNEYLKMYDNNNYADNHDQALVQFINYNQ